MAEAVAIVTGGANGIGEAVCRKFAAAGINVGIVDCDAGGANRVANGIISEGGKAEGYCADVTDEGQVRDVVKTFTLRHGHIDILANIAGGSLYVKRVEELSWMQWKEEIDMNVKGTFLFCHEVTPVMIEERRGSIVNTASNYGLTGCPMRTSYSAAKAAIIGFTKSLALELAPYGILVNAIAPGPTDTPRVLARSTPEARRRWADLIPAGRTARPEEIAEAVYFLTGPDSSYMTGYTLHINGGLVTP